MINWKSHVQGAVGSGGLGGEVLEEGLSRGGSTPEHFLYVMMVMMMAMLMMLMMRMTMMMMMISREGSTLEQ